MLEVLIEAPGLGLHLLPADSPHRDGPDAVHLWQRGATVSDSTDTHEYSDTELAGEP